MKYQDSYQGDNEAFFRSLASLYIEDEGEKLKHELETEYIEIDDIPQQTALYDLDKNVNKAISAVKLRQFVYMAAPVAACFLIALLYISKPAIPNNGTADTFPPLDTTIQSTPTSAPAEITLLSTKLPEGCVVTKTDYDYDKMIYYIRNAQNNNIVLVSEPFTEIPPEENFDQITVNGITAYYMSKKDYKILFVRNNDALYTLSSEFNVQDLVDIASSIV